MSKSKLDIRRAMTEHNISYAVLSERTGIDKGNISKLFTGNITYKRMESVADAIGCDIIDLFYPMEESNEGSSMVSSAQFNEQQGQEHIHETMFCPRCGTKFVIVHTPKDQDL